MEVIRLFLNYVNNLRGIAILLIISWHCTGLVGPFLSQEIYNAIAVILRDGTIVFVFISGFLFQYLSKKYKYSKFIKSKFLYVLMPYLLVSIPAILYMVYFSNMFENVNLDLLPAIFQSLYMLYPNVLEIIFLYFTGGYHLGPLWFIPMICIFYIISPLLIRLDKWKYFYCFLPFFLLLPFFVSRGINIFDNFLYFLPVYLYGMFFSKYRDFIMTIIEKRLILVILTFVTFSILSFIYRNTDFLTNSVIEHDIYIFWQKLFLSSLLIYLCYKYDSLLGRSFDFLAKASFGLFFTHQYLILILIRLFDFSKFSNGYLIFILFLSIIFVTSLSSFFLLISKKLFKNRSRLLIGY